MKDNDPRHDRLQAWTFQPSIPPRFQAEVWSRIQARGAERPETSFAAFVRWLFPSPVLWRFAAATAMLILVLGATLGNVAASAWTARSRAVLAIPSAGDVAVSLCVTIFIALTLFCAVEEWRWKRAQQTRAHPENPR
jgi:hypothetical protein